MKLKDGKEDACYETSTKVKEAVWQNTSRKAGKAIVKPARMVQGEHTLFVNAAIEDNEWTNVPWFVPLDLPVKDEMGALAEQCVEDLPEAKSLTEQSVVGALEVGVSPKCSPTVTKRMSTGEGGEENGTIKKAKLI